MTLEFSFISLLHNWVPGDAGGSALYTVLYFCDFYHTSVKNTELTQFMENSQNVLLFPSNIEGEK